MPAETQHCPFLLCTKKQWDGTVRASGTACSNMLAARVRPFMCDLLLFAGFGIPVYFKQAVEAAGQGVAAQPLLMRALLLAGACRMLAGICRDLQSPVFTLISQAWQQLHEPASDCCRTSRLPMAAQRFALTGPGDARPAKILWLRSHRSLGHYATRVLGSRICCKGDDSTVDCCDQAAGRRMAYHGLAHVLHLGPAFHGNSSTGALTRIIDRGACAQD